MKCPSREIPLHPFLFALFPVLTLLAGNLGEMNLSAFFRSAVASLFVASALFLILRLGTKDWRSAALLATFYLLLFFTYGHVYNLVKNQSLFGFDYGRHRILGIVWAVLTIVGGWLIVKRIHLNKIVTMVLNLVGFLLVIFPIVQIGAYAIVQSRNAKISRSDSAQSSELILPQGQLPDIYYIILDRYARDDILKSQLDYDNSEFTRALEQRGFYIARCSRSNYPETLPSMASALNMDYLDELTGVESWQENISSLQPYISGNAVRQLLEALGYQSISLTAYQNLQWHNADLFYNPATSSGSSQFSSVITPFEAILMRTTVLRIPLDLQTKSMGEFARNINYPYAEHVQQQLYILNKIPELPFLSAPTFAYIHITIPHPPYVFDQNGELVDIQTAEEGFTRNQSDGGQPGGYIGQVQYINQRMLGIVESLIQNSDQTPVIILQGDHGISGSDPDAILNAYLVPEAVRSHLYPTITPVNTFRVIFSSLFGGDYPALPDTSFVPGDVGQGYELSNPSQHQCVPQD